MKRDDVLGLALVTLLAVALWLPRLAGPLDLRWDGGVYATLGAALAEGKGYRLLNEPGEIRAVQYPPLFPAVIAVHRWLAGTDDPFAVARALRGFACAVFVAFAAATFLLFRRSLPLRHSILCGAIGTLHMNAFFYSDLCFPEISFALCTLGFMLLRARSRADSPAATLLLYAAFGLRSVGAALLAAWIGERLIELRFRAAAARLALALVPIATWQLYVASVEHGTERPAYEYQRAAYAFYNVSYATHVLTFKDGFIPELGHASWRDLASRFATNLANVPLAFGEAVSLLERVWQAEWNEVWRRTGWEEPRGSPAHAVVLFLGWLVIASLLVQFFRGRWLSPIYVFASTAMACVTPFSGQLTRYAMPLAPFLVLAVGEALALAEERVPERRRRFVVVAGTALLGGIVVFQALTAVIAFQKWRREVRFTGPTGATVRYEAFFYHDAYRVLDASLDWLRERADDDDVLALSMPHWAYLRTGRKAVMPPFELDPAAAERMLDSVPVTYLFVDPGLALDLTRYTLPVVRAFPDRWEKVYETPIADEYGNPLPLAFEIYRRRDAAPVEPASR